MEVEGKVAIVTGAARGIGRATALALAEAGASAVVVADVRRESAAETADLVRERGAEPLPAATDVARLDSLRELVATAVDRFGALHILHNNAGIGEGITDWPDVSEERAGSIVDVNLRGVIMGTRLALAPMKASGGGAIVQTASGAAFTPLPPQAVYAATKAGVVHFTRSCATLAQSHGVRVSCVCPGLVATPMVEETGVDGPAPWLRAIIDGLEMLSPDDVARAVLDLVRDPESAGRVVNLPNRARAG